jgi:hypothetical protein
MPLGAAASGAQTRGRRKDRTRRPAIGKEANRMHPATMQLVAEVRAMEMLLKPRQTRSIRPSKREASAAMRRFADGPAPTASAA